MDIQFFGSSFLGPMGLPSGFPCWVPFLWAPWGPGRHGAQSSPHPISTIIIVDRFDMHLSGEFSPHGVQWGPMGSHGVPRGEISVGDL